MNLLSYLRSDLVNLMKRRDRVALAAVREAISAIENSETANVTEPATLGEPTRHVAGAVMFGAADRVITALTDEQMMMLARAQVNDRRADAERYRELGEIDHADTLAAEALALAERLDAYPG